MIVVYGISNCDTVKKACRWLKDHSIDYQFHDFRKQGLTRSKVNDWLSLSNPETLINRRSTTWRNLPAQDKQNINKSTAANLMTNQPTLIKRPVIEVDDKIIIGFSETDYQQTFSRE